MSEYSVINIIDLLESLGEDGAKDIISDFSCPKNNEIENFLMKNAVDFAKRKISVTYLVFDGSKRLSGYFTLTHKSLTVPCEALSKTSRKKLENYAGPAVSDGCYDVSAFLIAQFGKNFSYNSISGVRLMELVFYVLKEIQHLIGGGVVFLECEDKKKLLDFYSNDSNRFKLYGERISEKENIKYLQLLRFF